MNRDLLLGLAHNRVACSRRDWLRRTGCGLLAGSQSGWLSALATQVAAGESTAQKRPPKACIVLWMSGGPSQLDTFDPKPGHAHGGPFQAIETSRPGIRIAEHLPGVARQLDHCAVIRSMSTKEGDHSRATYHLRTGYLPSGPVQFPTLGSFLGKELATGDSDLPPFVSIAPVRALSPAAFGPGFLGPRYAPLIVADGQADASPDFEQRLQVRNLARPAKVGAQQALAREQLLTDLEEEFLKTTPGTTGVSHRAAYLAALRMMQSPAVKAFDLEQESATLRDQYGRNAFGQGVLLARRLVERGVSFVEVTLGSAGAGNAGWDSHADNFNTVKGLCEVLDPAFSTLLEDLQQRGMLDSTLVVWMGEFGRTPLINPQTGRDHFPNAWSTVVGGGGIRGGQVVGQTADDGMTVTDRPV
ncbi:MAG: DUF1501 domain-containing protein, partial [Planctomycetaceae bacterium]